jgi:hypothetical protein
VVYALQESASDNEDTDTSTAGTTAGTGAATTMTTHTAGSPEVSVDSTQSTLDSPVENCATSKPGDTLKMATSMQSGEAVKTSGTQGSGNATTARGMEPDTSSMSTATDSVEWLRS